MSAIRQLNTVKSLNPGDLIPLAPTSSGNDMAVTVGVFADQVAQLVPSADPDSPDFAAAFALKADVESLDGKVDLGSLSTILPGTTQGYVGNLTKDNFGVHWTYAPFNYDATSGTNDAVMQDKSALYTGSETAGWVRMFFGFENNVGASGLFQAGSTTFNQNRLD